MCASRGHPAVARKAAAGRRCCPLTGANRGIRLLDATNEYCERPRTSLQWIAVPDHNIGVLAYIQRPRSVRDSPDARRIVQVRLHRRPVAGFGIGRFTTYRQPPPRQREVLTRLHLPFPILSDQALELTQAIGLPTFSVAGMTLLKRMALVIDDGVIGKVFYPVFPPDKNAGDVVAWLQTKQ